MTTSRWADLRKMCDKFRESPDPHDCAKMIRAYRTDIPALLDEHYLLVEAISEIRDLTIAWLREQERDRLIKIHKLASAVLKEVNDE